MPLSLAVGGYPRNNGPKIMKRVLLAIALTAPLLAGCIIITTDEPTTSHSSHSSQSTHYESD